MNKSKMQFADFDACFFCLGVSSIGVSEGEYHHLTYDLTLAAATAIASGPRGRRRTLFSADINQLASAVKSAAAADC